MKKWQEKTGKEKNWKVIGKEKDILSLQFINSNVIIMPKPNFVIMCQAVLNIRHADRWTHN
jgi:hypothetical protein